MRFHDVALCAGARALPLLRAVPWLVPWVTNQAAAIFIGRRNGRLHGNHACMTQLRASLHPLDILLSRSAFRISDHFIPSFFTHAAIYIGDDRPALPPLAMPGWTNRPAGTAVLEAARTGVRLTTLEAVTDVDVLVVLRDHSLSRARREAIMTRVGRELGKDYDFWYDERDDRRIFCSKLVARLFTHLPLDAPAQQRGLSLPDDIARLALAPNPVLSLEVLLADQSPISGCLARRQYEEFLA
jgi:hypothetical protein